MRSRVAEEMKQTVLGEVAGLSLDQRIELMFEIAEQDLQALMASSGVTRQEALRNRKRLNGLARPRPSRCHLPD